MFLRSKGNFFPSTRLDIHRATVGKDHQGHKSMICPFLLIILITFADLKRQVIFQRWRTTCLQATCVYKLKIRLARINKQIAGFWTTSSIMSSGNRYMIPFSIISAGIYLPFQHAIYGGRSVHNRGRIFRFVFKDPCGGAYPGQSLGWASEICIGLFDRRPGHSVFTVHCICSVILERKQNSVMN